MSCLEMESLGNYVHVRIEMYRSDGIISRIEMAIIFLRMAIRL